MSPFVGLAASTARTHHIFRQTFRARGLAHLAWRKHLAGSESPTFPVSLRPFQFDLPHALHHPPVVKADLKKTGSQFKNRLLAAVDKHGAVLIRGLPLKTGEEFAQFYSGFDLKSMEYVGGVSKGRDPVKGDVFLSSRDPPNFTIEPHQEMSYNESYPDLFFLFCVVPPGPGCGGESGVTDAREVARKLDPEVVEKFRRLGVKYRQYLPDRAKAHYVDWQGNLRTESKAEAEDILKKANHDFEWDEEGALAYTTKCLPAFRKHPRTGEMIWFNQVFVLNPVAFRVHPDYQGSDLPDEKFPIQSFYGDGSPIELDVLQHIREVTWKCTVGEQLRVGELLVLDNMTMMHSRLGFTGPRKFVVSQALLP
ncbi:uncharacterized protein LOC135485070 [Lineus longissimus]|uniref:uncharacterized protein LOC135485070 n=1 Tax=Lineus longissimus TaxID=88925 RepID=UPI00315DD183